MRQDIIERERQIRRLHQSIQKYEQSPNSKKMIEKSHKDLVEAIDYKFNHSSINAAYKFPRKTCDSDNDDEMEQIPQIINLHQVEEPNSVDLSIAEEPISNIVYISTKTILSKQKNKKDGLSEAKSKSKLKIKICRKKYIEPCSSMEKIKRFKTDYTASTHCLKSVNKTLNQEKFMLSQDKQLKKNESNLNVSSTIGCHSGFKKKIKEIYNKKTKREKDKTLSPFSTHVTLKTQHFLKTQCTPMNKGKQNKSVIFDDSSKNIQNLKESNKKMLSKFKTNTLGGKALNQKSKKKLDFYRSYDNLKSVRLGNKDISMRNCQR